MPIDNEASSASNSNKNNASPSPPLTDNYQWSYQGIEQFEQEFRTSYTNDSRDNSDYTPPKHINSNKAQTADTVFSKNDSDQIRKKLDSNNSNIRPPQANEPLEIKENGTETENLVTKTESMNNQTTVTEEPNTSIEDKENDDDDDLDKLLELPQSSSSSFSLSSIEVFGK